MSSVSVNLEQNIWEDLYKSIPPYDTYLTSEEVAQSFRALEYDCRGSSDVSVKLEPVTPEGEALGLDVLTVQPAVSERESLKTAVLKGNVHSNELVWTRSVQFLSRYLCENPELLRQLGYRFIFFDADPGATDLNDRKVFNGQSGIRDVLYGSFRSSSQVDWGYPEAEGKPGFSLGAGVGAFIIQKYRPEYWQSLHDGALGGSYAYASRDVPDLWKSVSRLRQILGLPDDQCDYPYAREYAQSVYKMPGINEIRENDPGSSLPGENSLNYHFKNTGEGSLAVIDEVPRFVATKDEELSVEQLRAARSHILARINGIVQQCSTILELAGTLEPSSPLQQILKSTRNLNRLWRDTCGHWTGDFHNMPNNLMGLYKNLFWAGRVLGQACRLAENFGPEREAKSANDMLDVVAADIELAVEPRTVPVKTRVAMQIGTAMLALNGQLEVTQQP